MGFSPQIDDQHHELGHFDASGSSFYFDGGALPERFFYFAGVLS